jgi:hypothetical protein
VIRLALVGEPLAAMSASSATPQRWRSVSSLMYPDDLIGATDSVTLFLPARHS